ncbi:MAG TPA: glycoside hydrolase family 2 TIM barrel-domain containing protein [Verrucomicrobiae bacterium]
MKIDTRTLLGVSALLFIPLTGSGQDVTAVSLPQGVRAVWDLGQAYREATPTRERVCLNGLWRWQPAKEIGERVPTGRWGYFKVPGCWPGITDYMQKDCQTLYAHPDWKDVRLGEVTAAWYQREFSVPTNWGGRRIALSLDYLNSFATVAVDGQKAGELRFSGGEVDLTTLCRPGGRHLLSIAVIAMPLKGVMLSYSDTFGARKIQGRVERRGLCGDVYLVGEPASARVANVKVSTSVRNWTIGFDAALQGLEPQSQYTLRANVTDHGRDVKEITSPRFKGGDVEGGRFSFTGSWKADKLWDTHTPTNAYEASLSLLDARGRVLDTALPERFGFREFWIDGRDFYLNGSRIFLCAVPLDNAQMGAAWATYEGTRESLQRLKSFGVNFVYTHNYGCEPGTHLSFAEVLRAADDEGMLVSFSQPHFGQYDWKAADADQNNGYARHAAFYVRVAQNHPSVVCYSMSHNATGTEESMNPDMIDGVQDARNQWSANNVKQALRAEAIVRALDPSRIVYHHSSGNLSSMHTANFYANFAPIQEMSDWFEHWATTGVKPVFLCEYGVPIAWDWMMYRGWYKGVRTFGSAVVPWELCMAEWNAQFLGDRAYQITDVERDCLRWEAKRFRDGPLWHRWDYPRNAIESPDFEQRNAIFTMYLTDNLRAFRTWGVSAFCPWDHGLFWKLREAANRTRKDLKVDWDDLQRPGLSPDYVEDQMAWMNTSFERADWLPTSAAQALYRNNLPLLAYLGGKPAAFTSKDHNFLPGDKIEKQIIVINNSRQTIAAECVWSFALPKPISGRQQARVATGQQLRVPVTFALPAQTEPGQYELTATVRFSNGEVQRDTFAIDVLPRPKPVDANAKIALFDPKGETGKLMKSLGVECAPVDGGTDLSGYDVLIVGQGALAPDSPGPDVGRVRDGLKVIVFEQSSETLEQRFGFRVAEYGLRRVFKRVPDHPLLEGIGDDQLRDWCGQATLLPPKLKYVIGQRHAPEVKWCGIPVTRLWRAGNRGNVASVLIEKPARGDFLPILDGGFGLQFSPLLEYHDGKGLVLFCQVDVTGRTESDPAAETLARNLVRYAATWRPALRRQVVYAGDPSERKELELAGFSPRAYETGKLSQNDVLVVGPGGGKQLASDSSAIAEFTKTGGNILALGLDEEEAKAFLPFEVKMKGAEHIAAFFPPFSRNSPLAGVAPADVLNRDPRVIPLVSSGVMVFGGGVLAQATNVPVVFCQLVPAWFGSSDQSNLRRTYRRTSALTTRLLANLGASGSTPVLERFHQPVRQTETRWLEGLYLDKPQEWDDPYRFFCW